MHRFIFQLQLFAISWSIDSGGGGSVSSGTNTSASGTTGNDTITVSGTGSFIYANVGGSSSLGGGVDTFVWVNGNNSGTTVIGDEYGTNVTVGYNNGSFSLIREYIPTVAAIISDPSLSYNYGNENNRIAVEGTALRNISISTDGGRDLVRLGSYFDFLVDMGDADDTIEGLGKVSNSTMYGGLGNDSIIFSDGINNTVDAGDGNDTIHTAGSFSSFAGGTGDDFFSISSNSYYNTVNAGADNDTIVVSGNPLRDIQTTILGGDGDDLVSLELSTRGIYFDGGDGRDSLYAANTATLVSAFMGDDDDLVSISTAVNDVTIDGGEGNDLILSNAGNTTMDGNVSLVGGDGDDTIRVGENGSNIHNITIDGGTGSDLIYFRSNYGGGSSSNSSINGGDGNDTIIAEVTRMLSIDAGNGDNLISLIGGTAGGGSSNVIYTGFGNDSVVMSNIRNSTVTTGAGNDYLTLRSDGTGNSGSLAADLDVSTGDGDDYVVVDTHSNRLTLDAGKGNDTIDFVSGNQVTLHGNDNDDVIILLRKSTAMLAMILSQSVQVSTLLWTVVLVTIPFSTL